MWGSRTALLLGLAVGQFAQAIDLLMNEPVILYTDVSPKLRIITKSSAFSGAFHGRSNSIAEARAEIIMRGAHAVHVRYRFFNLRVLATPPPLPSSSTPLQGLMASDIECTFTPSIDPASYTISIANDIMLSLVLNPGKK